MQLKIVEPEKFFHPGILIPCQDRSEGLYEGRKETKKQNICWDFGGLVINYR
jgi:hypothetical protein